MMVSKKFFMTMRLGAVCFLAVGLAGCGKSGDDGSGGPTGDPASLTLSAQSVTIDRTEKTAAVDITFTNFTQLQSLQVKKINGSVSTTSSVSRFDLTKTSRYTYARTSGDRPSLTLEFVAVSLDGTQSMPQSLEVKQPDGLATVRLDQTSVVPDAAGTISVDLALGNLPQLDYLLVERVDWDRTEQSRYQASDLTPRYTFEYTLKEGDSDEFTFTFTAVDKEGWLWPVQTLTVKK